MVKTAAERMREYRARMSLNRSSLEKQIDREIERLKKWKHREKKKAQARELLENQSSGTSSKEEEKKKDPLPLQPAIVLKEPLSLGPTVVIRASLPLMPTAVIKEPLPHEPTVVIKEEPVDYEPPASTTTSITNEEFILPHNENIWTPPANVPPEPVAQPQILLAVPNLASTKNPETSVGEQLKKKRKTETIAATLAPSMAAVPAKQQSPVYNFGENSNPDSSMDQFEIFGQYVAAKLRSLDRTSCAFAQKAIGDIIFDAEIGKFLNGEKECFS